MTTSSPLDNCDSLTTYYIIALFQVTTSFSVDNKSLNYYHYADNLIALPYPMFTTVIRVLLPLFCYR